MSPGHRTLAIVIKGSYSEARYAAAQRLSKMVVDFQALQLTSDHDHGTTRFAPVAADDLGRDAPCLPTTRSL